MICPKPHFKSGATSFYVVAIATLILVILATSFATATLAEIIRSANDELAQSAYDSALAGIEEAKLAYANYQNCINRGFTSAEPNGNGELTCPEIIYWMEHPDCDMVARILGRIKDGEEGRAINLEETATGKTSDLDQAYTCVTIDTNPQDVYGSLGLSTPYKVISVDNNLVPLIDTVVLKWHKSNDNSRNSFSNAISTGNPKIEFHPISSMGILPTPATISLQIVQTSDQGFTFDQLNSVPSNGRANRSTLFFIPTNSVEMATVKTTIPSSADYIGIYDSENHGGNFLSASQVAKDSHSKNLPYVVYCDTENPEEFACSVNIELPSPIGGSSRSDVTFYLVLSLPYGGPNTNYSIEYNCHGGTCNFSNEFEDATAIKQVVIDSTGRAGDMYKRIEVRLGSEISASAEGYPFYAIQADSIYKIASTSEEWGIEEDLPEPDPEPEPPEVITCTDESPYMQNWTGSSSLAVGETIYMRDRRDNECYSVAKLESGQVWMTTNLNLGSSSPMTLTSADTNLNNGLSTYTLPASSDSWNLSHSDGDPITQKIYKSGNATGDCQTERCYTYYSYTAATAGADPLASGDATSDICPRGWKIPSVGEARALTIGPFTPGPRPSAFPSFISEHYATFFWLSTTFYYTSADHTHDYTCEEDDICDHAFLLSISSETFQAGMIGISKGVGRSVLCIKK